MKHLFKIFLTFIVFAASMGTVGNVYAKSSTVLDRIVASVNNDAITETELDHQTQLLLIRLRQTDNPMPPIAELRKQILDRLIIEKLQLQMAKEYGVIVDDKTVANTLNEMAKRDGLSVSQLQKFVEEQGIPFPEFRKTIRNELTISRLQNQEIGHSVNISAKEVDSFLKSPAGQDQTGAEYRLGHILISLPEEPSQQEVKLAENRAKELLEKLKSGANFSEVAMAKSAGQQALNGGDLGFRRSAELPSLFAKIAPGLQVGEVYGPIRNSSGFHLVKLLDKRHGFNLEVNNKVKDKEKLLRNKAMEVLYQRRYEEQLMTWLRRIREEAQIEVYLNNEAA